MASTTLTKSYLSTKDPNNPMREDLLFSSLVDSASKAEHDGELLLLETNERIRCKDMFAKARRYAKGLIDLGLKSGVDRIAVIAANSSDIIAILIAASQLGYGYAHPFVYGLSKEDLKTVLTLLKPKVIVIGEGFRGEPRKTLMSILEDDNDDELLRTHIFHEDAKISEFLHNEHIRPLEYIVDLGKDVTDDVIEDVKLKVTPDTELYSVFTSGSTGRPKNVIWTQMVVANEVLCVTRDMSVVLTQCINLDDVASYATICLLLIGKINKLVVAPDYLAAEDKTWLAKFLCDTVTKERVEYFITPSVLISCITSYFEKHGGCPFPIKMIHYGGQMFTEEFKRRNEQIMGGLSITGYGLSECHCISMTPFGDDETSYDKRMRGIMYPKPNIEVRIFDDEGKVVEIGLEGEIQVKTWSRMKEYRMEKEKTASMFTRDGYFKTGDLGVMYADGSIAVKGRLADRIRFKIFAGVQYAQPIEDALSRHPSVNNVKVFSTGVNDWMGDEITYGIQLREGKKPIPEEELLNLCPGDERPARVFYFKQMPLTRNNRKVSVKKLREMTSQLISEDPDAGKTEWFKKVESGITLDPLKL